ncbi:methyl-accepting chemotaxis protein [Caulobacter sp. ErkDOM-YI]|uniref:methyl-accepting chemotaxis protein n=1 Tax=unclassified Caulobacter TaxID=2648921 RepID=UPI003AF64EA1
MNLKLRDALNLFAGALLLGFILATATAVFSLIELRVGGPLSKKQAHAYELLADILPPPLFLVEAMLLVHHGAEDTGQAEATLATLQTLKSQDEQRRDYWRKADLPKETQVALDQSQTEMDAFWAVVEKKYAPALKAGDIIAINTTLAELEPIYARHRKVIDSLTVMAAETAANSVIVAEHNTKIAFSLLAATTLLMLALVVIGTKTLRNFLVTPLSKVSAYMGQLAAGDFTHEVPMRGRADEIGDMARSVDSFRTASLERQAAKAAEHLKAAQEQDWAAEAARADERTLRQKVVECLGSGLRQLAEGDLTRRVNETFPREFERLRADFNSSLETLEETMSRVLDSTSAVDSGSREISSASDDLARRTEQQAANLQETAAALGEVTATIRQTAANASEAQKATAVSRTMVGKSSAVANEAITAMERIDASSQKIGQIIGVIDEIAFQTNLLALNAGVEAARAGEAGRGFAVVAQEVRALAQRSANAAKEIKTLVTESSDSVQSGVGLVVRVGEELAGVVDHFGRIESLISTIASAAQQQAIGLAEVNTAVGQMDQVTQQNAAMVEQTTAASHSLTREAGELGKLIKRFTVSKTSATSQAA